MRGLHRLCVGVVICQSERLMATASAGATGGAMESPSLPLLSSSEYVHRLRCAAEVVSAAIARSFPSPSSPLPPLCAVVLGSGLSDFSSRLTSTLTLSYSAIPFLPQPAVSGHHGELCIGRLPHPASVRIDSNTNSTHADTTQPQPQAPTRRRSITTTTTTTTITTTVTSDDGATTSSSSSSSSFLVLCFSGRVHSYEGHLPSSVCFISRLCALLSCQLLVLTNSAGGSGAGMVEGSVMLMTDHIRACAVEPLTACTLDEEGRLGEGEVDALTSPFLYPASLHAVARSAAASCGVQLHEGVYHWSSGPCYESWAEVRAGIALGTSAFGMSTVPEALAAAALGLHTLCLSLCTNLAAGLTSEQLTHEAVKAVAQAAGPRFQTLLHHTLHSAMQSMQHPASLPHTSGALKATATPTTVAPSLSTAAAGVAALDLHLRVGWCPSLSEVEAAAAFVREADSRHPPPRAALILATGATDAEGVAWTEEVSLPLCSLPGLPSPPLSRSSATAQLRLASFGGQRWLRLCGVQREGFTAAEAAWLAQLLALLRVTALLQVGAAVRCSSSSSSSSASAPALLLLDDVLDRTMEVWPALCLPCSPPAPSAGPSAVFSPALSSWLVSASSSSALTRGCIGFFAGPSWPCHAERAMAKAAGCAAVAAASPSLPILASRLGIDTAALFVLHDSGEEVAVKRGSLSVDGANSSSRSAAPHSGVQSIVQRFLSYHSGRTVVPSEASPFFSFSASSSTASSGCSLQPYGPAQPAWEEVQGAASRLLAALSSGGGSVASAPSPSPPSPLTLPRLLLLCHPRVQSGPPPSLTSLWQSPLAALLRSHSGHSATSSSHLSTPSPSSTAWTLHVGAWNGAFTSHSSAISYSPARACGALACDALTCIRALPSVGLCRWSVRCLCVRQWWCGGYRVGRRRCAVRAVASCARARGGGRSCRRRTQPRRPPQLLLTPLHPTLPPCSLSSRAVRGQRPRQPDGHVAFVRTQRGALRAALP